ncbi:hypothetical protein F443_12628, partial [Phytophthora nicotianae P1569]
NMVYSALYWRERCIADSSTEEENTAPNLSQSSTASEQHGYSSTGTVLADTPPRKLKPEVTPPRADGVVAPATPPYTRPPHSPTTSSPVLLETPPAPLPRSQPRIPLRDRRSPRRERREATQPYHRRQNHRREAASPSLNPQGLMRTSPRSSPPSRARERRYRDRFLLADWPVRVAHLRAQYKPTGLVFPAVPHYGWCDCSEPCRVGACRNSLMQLYCTPSCCPYDAKCGNSLEESTKVYLARNTRTLQLSVVAVEDIDAGEVLGQYLGEFEHVSVDPARRPRNEGFRLMMTQRPERPSHPIRVAVNAAEMGGLMRFVNHSCSPVAQFVEVANGRRTTVVVATTEVVREGEEITVDYGGDLWFVCRCGLPSCRHREIQDQRDP